MQFRVLGPLEVDAGDGPVPLGGPKQRAVLASLLVRANEVVPADTLIAEVWGEEAPDKARNTLQTYVSNLRRGLGNGRLRGRAPGYVLMVDPPELDAAQFDALVREAKRTLPTDPGAAVATLDNALALWRGPALADLSDQTSLLPEAARLDELRLDAEADRIEGLLASGEGARAIGELEALVARHPLRERLWGLLMLALYREGRQAEALGAFQRAREILADELGVDPSTELARLQLRILEHDAGLDLRGEPLRGYRLLEQLGEGSFGIVHRAIQPHVGREVAIKAITPELANDPEFVRRFEAEAQMIARLEHPYIVPLYDYWRDPDGAFLVMRYLSGGSLRRRLEEQGALDPEDAAGLVEQIAQALTTAHRQGVVHRDVKPENVLLDEDRNAYLSDFGIAKDTSDPRATRTGPLGTPAYLSPEQIRGERVSPQTDVHGLGVVLYEALTGEHPFPGGSIASLLERILHDPLPSIHATRPELSSAIDEVLARATAKEPALRYADAISLAAAFRGTLDPDAIAIAAADAPNPYKGLRPFTEADAGEFFGREALVERLVARLAENGDRARFLGVVGPSGSGKSSAVRAGLIPALRAGALDGSRDWFYVEMAPGAHPLDQLEAALLRVAVTEPPRLREQIEDDGQGLPAAIDAVLPDEGSRLVVVVDQLEETFTLVQDEGERRRFLDRLASVVADPRVRVVATLRADFYDRPLAYPGFGELLAARTEAVPALTPDELEQAIRSPAEQVGVLPEPGLVAEMIADVANQPGALPLAQYALTELFERRDDHRLTLASYREIGRVAGALSARAERILEDADDDGREAIRQVFLRLVTLGEGREDTRRLVTRTELDALDEDPAAIERVLETFGRHRLLTFDREPATREPTVEIAHEALLGAWDRLQGWIDDAREDLRQERRLSRSAAEWHASDRDPSFLLRGARLEQTEAWTASTDVAIGRPELAYVKASTDQRDVEQGAEEQRRQHEVRIERRSRNRLRGLVAVFAVAALVAASLTIVATDQSERAERESRIASARELSAAAVSSIDEDPELAILLATEAVERTRSVDGTVLPEAIDALHRAVGGSRVVARFPDVGVDLDWGPTGVFATEHPDGSGVMDLRDDRTGASRFTFAAHDGDVTGIAFSADGSMLATTGVDGSLRVWDPATGEPISHVQGDRPALAPSFSEDGSLIAATWRDKDFGAGSIRIADPATGEVVRASDELIAPTPAALSDDGERVAFMAWDGERSRFEGRVFATDPSIDIPSPRFLTPPWVGPNVLQWSPDGSTLVGAPWVWDAATGRRSELEGHTEDVLALDGSQRSGRMVTGSDDGTARVWDVSPDGSREVLRLPSEDGRPIHQVAFSADGTHVMTTEGTGTIRIWDVGPSGDAEWAHLTWPGTGNVDFLPDGRMIGARGGAVVAWDPASGRVEQIGPPIRYDLDRLWAPLVDASPDGRFVAVTDYEGLRVWETDTGDVTFEMDLEAPPTKSAWSPDGELLSLSQPDDSITLVDPYGDQHKLLTRPGSPVHQLRFSPDGRLLAVAGGPGTDECEAPSVEIWDWERGVILTEIATCAYVIGFEADGERLVTVGYTQPMLWDVRSGALIGTYPEQPANFVREIALGPDGATLALTFDETIRLFDAKTREPTLVLEGHPCLVEGLAFSPDGTMLASRACDGIRVWALDIDDLLEIARANVARSLTESECRQFLHLETCPDP